jgi:signal transduction histidine kinase
VEHGQIVGTQSAIRDITERKLAEQMLESQNAELKKINLELDRFVYSTSHDLRAPLLSLHGLIDLCQNSKDLSELELYFQMMTRSIDRIDATIREILEYSKNSRLDVQLEDLRMEAVVENVLENFKVHSASRFVHFEVRASGHLPFFSDRPRVNTILNNLVSNAVNYQRPDVSIPLVRIEFHADANYGYITVTDNGEGIAPDKLEKIFEMFYRNSEKSVGSGLGLYICKEIVNKLGGLIRVKSDIGKGSSFTIQIPNHAN